MNNFEKPYRDFNSYLRELFGCRVQKITLDAGLTCPNRDGAVGYGGCIYCNARGSGTGLSKSLSIRQQIERGKEILGKRYKARKFLGYFQSFSNTYAPIEKLKSLYEEALSVPDVVGLCIGTRPDCVSAEILDLLAEYRKSHLIWLEYGLQSAKNETLRIINRGHSVEDFVHAVERTRKRKIPICVHVILGLPGETAEDMINTSKFLADLDIQGVKIHLLYVIKETRLHHMYKEGAYRCLDRETYVKLVGEFIAHLPPHVVIQRITGDPHREELVAPIWALEKRKNINLIHEYMRKHDLYQGKFWQREGKKAGEWVLQTEDKAIML